MKILQITSHLNTGGITRYVLTLSKQLVQNGHQVIIASDRGEKLPELGPMGVEHWEYSFYTSVEFSPQVLWGAYQLSRRLKREPVDVIHAHTRVAQVVAARLSRQLGIPYVATWHGIYGSNLGRRLWPCAGDRTIAISQVVFRHLLEDVKFSKEKIRCVHNGIDTERYLIRPEEIVLQEYRQRWQLSEHWPVIGSIGRLAAGGVKGFDLLLRAAVLLVPKFPNLRILLAGEGPRRSYLQQLAQELGIDQKVRFVGVVEDIRIPLALMDLFIFPSRWPEAFGLTLVEAMAAGKPVIATMVGAVPEIVQHGSDGWLVEPDNVSLLAGGILKLLQDKSLAEKLARSGQRQVREKFHVGRFVSEIEAVYREVIQ
ncbi:MAG: glycosyltransferase family 4 protein [Candidatus Omnitrophica bacterium]|nr:glycosyltransferase family 4 protein [Candidatus Omnitrophota bacterium]